jgi:hypothetical protein
MGTRAPDSVRRLVDRFDRDRKAFLSPDYKEEQLRAEFLNPFFESLGWDVANKAGLTEVFKPVIHEESIKVAGATKAPDSATYQRSNEMLGAVRPCLLLAVTVAILAGCATESSFWRRTEHENSLTGYRDFLERYPRGKYEFLAERAMEPLLLEDVRQRNEVAYYEQFIRDYPQSERLAEVRAKRDRRVQDVKACKMTTFSVEIDSSQGRRHAGYADRLNGMATLKKVASEALWDAGYEIAESPMDHPDATLTVGPAYWAILPGIVVYETDIRGVSGTMNLVVDLTDTLFLDGKRMTELTGPTSGSVLANVVACGVRVALRHRELGAVFDDVIWGENEPRRAQNERESKLFDKLAAELPRLVDKYTGGHDMVLSASHTYRVVIQDNDSDIGNKALSTLRTAGFANGESYVTISPDDEARIKYGAATKEDLRAMRRLISSFYSGKLVEREEFDSDDYEVFINLP